MAAISLTLVTPDDPLVEANETNDGFVGGRRQRVGATSPVEPLPAP